MRPTHYSPRAGAPSIFDDAVRTALLLEAPRRLGRPDLSVEHALRLIEESLAAAGRRDLAPGAVLAADAGATARAVLSSVALPPPSAPLAMPVQNLEPRRRGPGLRRLLSVFL